VSNATELWVKKRPIHTFLPALLKDCWCFHVIFPRYPKHFGIRVFTTLVFPFFYNGLPHRLSKPTEQNRSKQNRTDQNRSEQSRAKQNRTEQNNRRKCLKRHWLLIVSINALQYMEPQFPLRATRVVLICSSSPPIFPVVFWPSPYVLLPQMMYSLHVCWLIYCKHFSSSFTHVMLHTRPVSSLFSLP